MEHLNKKWGVDFDGVLCEAFHDSNPKTFYKMNGVERKERKAKELKHYVTAPLIFSPEFDFVCITARKDNPTNRRLSALWLVRNSVRAKKLYMLNTARTIKNVGIFKANVIRIEKITDYIEDNPDVLKEIKKHIKINLYIFKDNKYEPF